MNSIDEKLEYLKGTKDAIKNAIIKNGIDVSDSDAFRSYADKIAQLQSEDGISYSGGDVTGDLSINSENFNKWTSILNEIPYSTVYGAAVVLNNEIHIFGGTSKPTNHYKWDGSSWVSVSTIPYQFAYGCAVVLNNEIHLLGSSAARTNHYKWDGSSWTKVSSLPYEFYYGSAVVLNNEIHILGSLYMVNTTEAHYKWDGSSWTKVSSLPFGFANGSTGFAQGCAVVLNNEIHILGGRTTANKTAHYKWDGSSWTKVSSLPYEFTEGAAVVLNNEIHILDGAPTGYNPLRPHYKWDGSSWAIVSSMTYSGCSNLVVTIGSEIHNVGGYNHSICDYAKIYHKYYLNGPLNIDGKHYTLNNIYICQST